MKLSLLILPIKQIPQGFLQLIMQTSVILTKDGLLRTFRYFILGDELMNVTLGSIQEILFLTLVI